MGRSPRADAPWKEPLHDEGPVVIFDVDGVIADMSDFAHLVETERAAEKKWKAFHAHFGDAAPIRSGVTTVNKIFHDLDIDVAYSTTRREQYARRTLWWMDKHNVPMGPMQLRQLIKDGSRPDDQVKLRHWWTWQKKFAAKNPVLAWIEDDPHCRNLLQKHGCPAWGPKELRRAALSEQSLRAALDKGPVDRDELAANAIAAYPEWKAEEDAWQEHRRQWWAAQRRKQVRNRRS